MGTGIAFALENAQIVNGGQMARGAVSIGRDGRIAEVVYGDARLGSGAERVIDCEGDYLLPGLVDGHVHFREPGLTAKGDLASESKAAVAGGVTSFIDMPNTKPITDSVAEVRAKCALAHGQSWANYGFHLGATRTNLEEIRAAYGAPVAAVKLFMGASTGNMQVDDAESIALLFRHSPLPVLTHCERDARIAEGLARAQLQYGPKVPFAAHAWIRGREGCLESTQLAVALAQEHNARLHVLHLSTREEAELFAALQGGAFAERITAETSPQYLLMHDGMYDLYGGLLKCNPSVKGAEDGLQLWEALRSGAIRTLGTDHAPHLMEEKLRPYETCPSGIASIQHHLCLLLDACGGYGVDVARLVETLCHAPATLFGIVERGYIREGYWADLVRVKPLGTPMPPTRIQLAGKCGWSLYQHIATRHCVVMTMVNGRLAFAHGEWIGSPQGQALRYDHALHTR